MLNCCRKWIKTSRISRHIILLATLTVIQSLSYCSGSRQPPQAHGGGGGGTPATSNRNLIQTEQQCKVRFVNQLIVFLLTYFESQNTE